MCGVTALRIVAGMAKTVEIINFDFQEQGRVS